MNTQTEQNVTTMTRKDIRKAAEVMSDDEARYLVDFYYIAQRNRIRFDNQVRSMAAAQEPTMVLDYLGHQAAKQEEFIKKSLDEYTKFNDVGTWLRSLHGIGPVTAAGLLAHIDIRRAVTAGAIWKFAGIDGVSKMEKGKVRPWNGTLRTLCFKIGESFVKTSNSPKSVYGKIYKERKELETAKNERGEYKAEAERQLREKNFENETITKKLLLQGKLSPAHIHSRARRYAVKIFLSHLHEVMYRVILGKEPPVPYAIGILHHAHRIEVPNRDMIKDFVEPLSDDIDLRDVPNDDE